MSSTTMSHNTDDLRERWNIRHTGDKVDDVNNLELVTFLKSMSDEDLKIERRVGQAMLETIKLKQSGLSMRAQQGVKYGYEDQRAELSNQYEITRNRLARIDVEIKRRNIQLYAAQADDIKEDLINELRANVRDLKRIADERGQTIQRLQEDMSAFKASEVARLKAELTNQAREVNNLRRQFANELKLEPVEAAAVRLMRDGQLGDLLRLIGDLSEKPKKDDSMA